MMPAKTYEELIANVQKIDPSAAEYLQTEAQKLPDFSPSSDLLGVFYWDNSPQGHDYWSAICRQLTA